MAPAFAVVTLATLATVVVFVFGLGARLRRRRRPVTQSRLGDAAVRASTRRHVSARFDRSPRMNVVR